MSLCGRQAAMLQVRHCYDAVPHLEALQKRHHAFGCKMIETLHVSSTPTERALAVNNARGISHLRGCALLGPKQVRLR